MLLSAGCESRVENHLRVKAGGGVSQEVRVVLEEDAADATLRNIEVAKESFAKQTGVSAGAVEVEGDMKHLEISAELQADTVAPGGGVGDFAVRTTPEGGTVLDVRTSDAGALKEAIAEAVRGEADGEAVRAAIGKSMEVCVLIEMPGDVTEVRGEGVTSDGREASVCRALDEWASGSIQVSSKAPESSGWGVREILLGGAVLGVAMFVDALRRRRQKR